jgi:hypothetical protein
MSFDRAELTTAVHHLAFDIHHFRFYGRVLKEGRLTALHPAVSQAILYSLLLHFRVLLDFFYKKPKHDDCCVGHFRVLQAFTAAFPTSINTPPPSSEEVSANLNKRLAHMTATRWREDQPDMSYYTDYFEGIDKLIVAFRAALPDDVGQPLDKRLDELEARYIGSILK